MNQMVVTNLRIPMDDYERVRALAGEERVSINSFINSHIKKVVHTYPFGKKAGVKKKKKINFYASMLELSNRKTKDKLMDANEDDKIIYGIDD